MPCREFQAIYLHGFASGPFSRKATFFEERLHEPEVPVLVPDLAQGNFKGLTITGQLQVIDAAVRGAKRPVVLIGSSLGGYLAALYGARHPAIAGLILLAPAFDFYNLWTKRMTAEEAESWRSNGSIRVYHYVFGGETDLGYQFLEDAKQFEPFPSISQPALIVHGTADNVVPIGTSERFVREHAQARLVRVASGHELTDVLEPLWQETENFLQELARARPMID